MYLERLPIISIRSLIFDENVYCINWFLLPLEKKQLSRRTYLDELCLNAQHLSARLKLSSHSLLSGTASENLGRFLQGIELVHTNWGLNAVSRYSWWTPSSLKACRFVFFEKNLVSITVEEHYKSSEIKTLISSLDKSNPPLSSRVALASEQFLVAFFGISRVLCHWLAVSTV